MSDREESPTKVAKKLKTEHSSVLTPKITDESSEAKKKPDQVEDDSSFEFSKEPSLEMLRRRTEEFALERNWLQYHTPRNLLLGITILDLSFFFWIYNHLI